MGLTLPQIDKRLVDGADEYLQLIDLTASISRIINK